MMHYLSNHDISDNIWPNMKCTELFWPTLITLRCTPWFVSTTNTRSIKRGQYDQTLPQIWWSFILMNSIFQQLKIWRTTYNAIVKVLFEPSSEVATARFSSVRRKSITDSLFRWEMVFLKRSPTPSKNWFQLKNRKSRTMSPLVSSKRASLSRILTFNSHQPFKKLISNWFHRKSRTMSPLVSSKRASLSRICEEESGNQCLSSDRWKDTSLKFIFFTFLDFACREEGGGWGKITKNKNFKE